MNENGSSDAAEEQDSVGEPLGSFDGFELIQEIARGGMGIVYKAREIELDRFVALKMIRGGSMADADARERFDLEARSAAKLHHPGIVPIYHIGEDAGWLYFTMELVEGESLAKRLEDGPLAWREAAELLKQAASAVQHAHEADVLHRDLKPSNFLIDEAGRARLTDFGLAKSMGEDSSISLSGEVIGTPAYMAPEQVGETKPEASPLTDVYGLGAVLYALLTGRPPFVGPTPLSILKQVEQRDPIPVSVLNPTVERDLETICAKCMHRSPERRYASCDELLLELERLLAGEVITARRVGAIERGILWAKRRPTVALLSVVSVVTLASGLIGITLQWRIAVSALEARDTATAERDRARLKTVLEVRSGLVPALLEDLQFEDGPGKDLMDALLADTTVNNRGRLRLARIKTNPSVLPEIARDMLSTMDWSPELRMHLEVLRQYADQIPAQDWSDLLRVFASRCEAGEANDLRARIAALTLASIDPAGELWKHKAKQIAIDLVHECSAAGPAWPNAFPTLPIEILDELIVLARADDPETRLRATNWIVRSGSWNLAYMLELLPSADTDSYLLLAEALDANSDAVVQHMRSFLTEDMHVNPQPRNNSSWQEVPESLALQIESHAGVISDQGAFVLGMAPAVFLELCEELRSCGYRPLQFKTTQETTPGISATWVRDDGEFLIEMGLTLDDLDTVTNEVAADGIFLLSLAATIDKSDPDSTPLYGALYGLPVDQEWYRVAVGAELSEPELMQSTRSFYDSDYSPQTHGYYRDRDGIPMHYATWVQSAYHAEFALPEAMSSAIYGADPYPFWCQTDVEIMFDETAPASAGTPLYNGAWRHHLTRESTSLHGLTPQEHRTRALELVAIGYEPVSIDLAHAPTTGQPSVASVWHRQILSTDDRARIDHDRATAGLTLLRMGAVDEALASCVKLADRGVRTSMASRAQGLKVDPSSLIDRLDLDADPRLLRACLLILASYSLEAIPSAKTPALINRCSVLAKDCIDPGVHSAATLCLRRWDQPVANADLGVSGVRNEDGFGWEITPTGQTLAILPRRDSVFVGAPAYYPNRSDVEYVHRRKLSRSFAISTTEITDLEYEALFVDHPELATRAPGSGHIPRVAVSWLGAARYCRWLSEQQGLPESEMCFPPVPQIQIGITLPNDFLDRSGYRLPTETEWEYACRADSMTLYAMGWDRTLLQEYAVTRGLDEDALNDVASKLPNDFGLFDMMGNAMEWCNSHYYPYEPSPPGTGKDWSTVEPSVLDIGVRILRGGSFLDPTWRLTPHARRRARPNDVTSNVGFRIARTIKDFDE
ncbi:MAG: sulfatase activating formylglycine-generating enzyme [Planctomycetota bacterium]